ncbi:MAG TPA: hypothetical protein EYQ42_01225 [Thiotrichaceae bacterium]|jgi:hypothetical protein|nr:hypothetical protein [Thiotrichaceae bacterium]HIM08844.1 hypothetical protein [Gammaproteobacteria bacterium]
MKLFVKQTRDLSFVPNNIWIVLILSLFLQCLWHFSFSRLEVKRYNLTIPPTSTHIRLMSLDDPVSAAKLTMLWLQAFDNQPGVSIPLKELNYDRVVEWLDIIIELDSKIQYPLLAAIRFYAEVQDVEKQRMMIRYVSDKFIESPNERWSFMAHAVYVAKHRIKDLKLALECAELIRQHAKGDNVPYWAKQMEIFILEDMNELESAMVILGGLIESGELKDSHQRKFLGQKLEEIKLRQNEAN